MNIARVEYSINMGPIHKRRQELRNKLSPAQAIFVDTPYSLFSTFIVGLSATYLGVEHLDMVLVSAMVGSTIFLIISASQKAAELKGLDMVINNTTVASQK